MLLAQVPVPQRQPLRLHNQPYEKYAGSVGHVIRGRETMFLVKLNAELPGQHDFTTDASFGRQAPSGLDDDAELKSE
jgi:hypothetical protein